MPESLAPADLYAELERITTNAKTWNRLMTTKAKIAQTPKELIWTLNKAKLYHYIPVVPPEQRRRNRRQRQLRADGGSEHRPHDPASLFGCRHPMARLGGHRRQ
jgi:hypothetical protein